VINLAALKEQADRCRRLAKHADPLHAKNAGSCFSEGSITAFAFKTKNALTRRNALPSSAFCCY
jgi:hypothetical protein